MAEGQRSISILVGFKLAQIQGDDALGNIAGVPQSPPQGQDNVDADPHNTLDALGLGPVVKAWSGGQRVVIASARSPAPARMDVVGDIAWDEG